MGWTKDWPAIPGHYWFYGWCFRDRTYPPEMHLVEVCKISNGVSYVTNGHFIYKGEGADGLWNKAHLPVPPCDTRNQPVLTNKWRDEWRDHYTLVSNDSGV